MTDQPRAPATEALEAAGDPFRVVRHGDRAIRRGERGVQGSGRVAVARHPRRSRAGRLPVRPGPGRASVELAEAPPAAGHEPPDAADRGGGEGRDRLRPGRDHAVRRPAPGQSSPMRAGALDLVAIGGGARGVNVHLAPADLIRATDAQVVDITVPEPPPAEPPGPDPCPTPLPTRAPATAARRPDGAQPSRSRPLAATPPGPLVGIRIADCSTVLAGPFATMLLARPRRGRGQGRAARGRRDARLGPAVGRVDEADGHSDRRLLPRGQPQQALHPPRPRDRAEGRDVLRRLLRDADVLVENFRVGGFARLGFDDDALRGAQPAPRPPRDLGLRHRTGRTPDKPGYDFVIQAVGGLMSITGAPDATAASRPRSGSRSATSSRGCSARSGSSPRSLGRERAAGRPGGRGQRIDVSLLEIDPRGARQPGPERVRHVARAGPAAATPTRTSSRTRRSRRPTARSRRGRQRAPVAAALRLRRLPGLATDRRSPPTATG